MDDVWYLCVLWDLCGTCMCVACGECVVCMRFVEYVCMSVVCVVWGETDVSVMWSVLS